MMRREGTVRVILGWLGPVLLICTNIYNSSINENSSMLSVLKVIIIRDLIVFNTSNKATSLWH